jgi:hypothetical protein
VRAIDAPTATLLAAAVGGLVALAVNYLARRASDRRWVREAKWAAYSASLNSSYRVLEGLAAAVVPKLRRNDNWQEEAVAAFLDLSRSWFVHPSGYLLRRRFTKALYEFQRFARDEVMPVINRAALRDDAPTTEMPMLMYRGLTLFAGMEIAAYRDLGWLSRVHWWAFRLTKRLITGRLGEGYLQALRRAGLVDDARWRDIAG